MDSEKDYSGLLDRLVAQNVPFAAWYNPGEETPELLVGMAEDVVFLPHFHSLNGQKGFVFAPFRITPGSPLVLLKPRVHCVGLEQIMTVCLDDFQGMDDQFCAGYDHFIATEPVFLESVRKTIEEIRQTKLSKVILSRIIPHERKDESVGQLFLQLRAQTPNAFVYLVNLPKAGLWMGATPEILLKSEGKTFETVSLAGTQLRKNNADYSWYTKEIEEQAFVSRYMLDVFYRFNIHPYTTQGPETMESGRVAHLKTSFFFPAKTIVGRLGEFVADLHPTPAVCGLPKSRADRFIFKNEKHDRRYYTGFLGPWRLNGHVKIFVNLRCMEISDKQYHLFSGGGVTAKSVPGQEWEETIIKAKTLLSAIDAVQNR